MVQNATGEKKRINRTRSSKWCKKKRSPHKKKQGKSIVYRVPLSSRSLLLGGCAFRCGHLRKVCVFSSENFVHPIPIVSHKRGTLCCCSGLCVCELGVFRGFTGGVVCLFSALWRLETASSSSSSALSIVGKACDYDDLRVFVSVFVRL